MLIRPATVADAEAIRTIYNAEVTGGTNTFDLEPWSLEQQIAWLDRHRGAHPAIVAEVDGTVAGFGSLSSFRSRAAYSTTVEDSVYVAAENRGQGVGRALLVELVRLAAEHGFHAVVARIVGHNEVSIGLHQACGFELVGVEREVGRKHRQWLDVVELELLV
jgi:phosphinothricin acetyltransferase